MTAIDLTPPDITPPDIVVDVTPSTLRAFIDYLLRHVDDDRFNMSSWMTVTLDDPHADIIEAPAYDKFGNRMAGIHQQSVDALVDYLQRTDYACVTQACIAGHAVMWDEQVRGGDPGPPDALDRRAAELLSDGDPRVRRALNRVFYDQSITTVAQAAIRLQAIADTHGL